MRYKVLLSNVERMEKKVAKIMKKAKSYGCDFHFEKLGEGFEMRNNMFGYKHKVRYIEVEVSGTAKIDKWQFVASLEKTPEGNIIKSDGNFEVPSCYYNSDGFCEHCGTNRKRKYLYIIRNIENGEFKQIGKSCLQSYTGGLSAEICLAYMDLFNYMDEIEISKSKACANDIVISSDWFFAICCEWFKNHPFVPASSGYEGSSLETIKELCNFAVGIETTKKYKELFMNLGLVKNKEENDKKIKEVFDWLKSIDDSSASNYVHNLKTLSKLESIPFDLMGIAVSVFNAYDKAKQKEEQTADKQEYNKLFDEFVKDIKYEIEFNVSSFEKVASLNTQYGLCNIYKFTNEKGIIFTWKTGKVIKEKPQTVKAKFKKINAFRGVKEVEISYCKLA